MAVTLYYSETASDDLELGDVMAAYHPTAVHMPELDMKSMPSSEESSWARGLGIDSSLNFPLFAEGSGAKKLIRIHRSWSLDKDGLWLVPIFETSIHFTIRARLLEWMSVHGNWLAKTFDREVLRQAPSQAHVYSMNHYESASSVDLLDAATTGLPPRTRVVYDDRVGAIVPWRIR